MNDNTVLSNRCAMLLNTTIATMKQGSTLHFTSRSNKGGAKMDIIFKIPNFERMLERIEELEACLNNFPDSPLVDIWKNELKALSKKIH